MAVLLRPRFLGASLVQTRCELSFVAGAPVLENLHQFIVFTLATSLGWDIGRAITTAVLVLITGRAVLRSLRRAARPAAFEEPVTFAASPPPE